MGKRPMRMNRREVTEPEKINAIIDEMDAIRIGFYDGEEVYILPLSFGYEEQEGVYTFYMHGSKKGRKAELVTSCTKVGFELDKALDVKTDTEPCSHTVHYHSIIGHGSIEEITDAAGKIHALNAVMKQNTGKGDWEYPEKMLEAVFVFKVTADWLTCKAHEG